MEALPELNNLVFMLPRGSTLALVRAEARRRTKASDARPRDSSMTTTNRTDTHMNDREGTRCTRTRQSTDLSQLATEVSPTLDVI
jgi:hypothetical protein